MHKSPSDSTGGPACLSAASPCKIESAWSSEVILAPMLKVVTAAPPQLPRQRHHQELVEVLQLLTRGESCTKTWRDESMGEQTTSPFVWYTPSIDLQWGISDPSSERERPVFIGILGSGLTRLIFIYIFRCRVCTHKVHQ
jgi:hypothetical protein